MGMCSGSVPATTQGRPERSSKTQYSQGFPRMVDFGYFGRGQAKCEQTRAWAAMRPRELWESFP